MLLTHYFFGEGIDNINGIIFNQPIFVPITLKENLALDYREILYELDSCEINSPKRLVLKAFPGKSSILIDKKGLYILANIVDKPSTSQNQSSLKYPEKIATNSITIEELQREFKELYYKFNNIQKQYFDLPEGGLITFAAITKDCVARIINNTFSECNLNLRCTIPIAKDKEFSKDIRIGHNDIPNCDKNCSSRLENCDKNCSSRCPEHCIRVLGKCVKRVRDPICMGSCKAQEEACNIRNARTMTKCKVQEEACSSRNARTMTKCKVQEEACSARNARSMTKCKAQEAECESVKASLNFVNGLLHVGSVHGQIDANAKIDYTLKSIHISPDLQSINIKSAINAIASINSTVWVDPKSIGRLACLCSFRKTFKSKLSFDASDYELTGDIIKNEQTKDDNKLKLSFNIPERGLIIKNDNPPYSQLKKDPGFFLNCTLVVITFETKLYKLFTDSDLPDAFTKEEILVKMPGQGFTIPISPIYIDKEEINLKLVPFLGKKSVGFSLKN